MQGALEVVLGVKIGFQKLKFFTLNIKLYEL